MSSTKLTLEHPEETRALIAGFSPEFIFAIVANILWGTTFLASKYTLQAWGPFTSAGLRFGIATIFLFLALKLLRKDIQLPSSSNQWFGLFLIATSSFGVLYPMQLGGLKYIPSSLSAAIMLTSPIAVLILGRMFLNDSLSTVKYIALGFGVLGGAILISSTSNLSLSFDSNFVLGTVLTLGASVSLAISAILTRRYSKGLSNYSLTFWTMAIGFIELGIAAFIFEEDVLASIAKNSNAIAWSSILFLAIVCSAFCFLLWNYAITKASPQQVASSMHIKTPIAVLIGVVIANESLTNQIIIGTIFVMIGVWLSQQKKLGGLK